MDKEYIDHEARIRLLEELLVRSNADMQTLKQKIENQFNVIAGTVVTSCIGIVLHMKNLL